MHLYVSAGNFFFYCQLRDTTSAKIKSAAASRVLKHEQSSRISVVGWRRSGISIGLHPAAWAARIPENASSNTRHCGGGTPILDEAKRNMSGAGFPCTTSSPVTITSNISARSAARMLSSTRLRIELDATAVRTPFSRHIANILRTPGLSVGVEFACALNAMSPLRSPCDRFP